MQGESIVGCFVGLEIPTPEEFLIKWRTKIHWLKKKGDVLPPWLYFINKWKQNQWILQDFNVNEENLL